MDDVGVEQRINGMGQSCRHKKTGSVAELDEVLFRFKQWVALSRSVPFTS